MPSSPAINMGDIEASMPGGLSWSIYDHHRGKKANILTEIVGIVQNAIARGQLADELADTLHLPLHFVLLLLAVHESLP